jgi:hypothetical protein
VRAFQFVKLPGVLASPQRPPIVGCLGKPLRNPQAKPARIHILRGQPLAASAFHQSVV